MTGMAANMETKPTLPLKIGDVIPGNGKPTPKALARYFAKEADDLAEVHSMEPWWLMQCRGGSEEVACAALKQEGFEPYYPTYRKFSPMPRNKIASHMRHKKRHAVQEKRLPLHPGYVLFRPLAVGIPYYDIYRLYELDGCGGLCTWARGEVPCNEELNREEIDRRIAEIVRNYPDPLCAPDHVRNAYMALLRAKEPKLAGARTDTWIEPILIPDYRVEAMRVTAAAGLNDQFVGVTEHAVMTGVVKEVGLARTMMTRGKIMARLDDGVNSSLFIDRGDRVIRVISSSHDAQKVGK